MFAAPRKQPKVKAKQSAPRSARKARRSSDASSDMSSGPTADEKMISGLLRANPLVGSGISGLSLLCYLWSAEQRSGRSSTTTIPDTILVRDGMPVYWFANKNRGMLELKPSKALASPRTVLEAFQADFQGPCALWMCSEDVQESQEASWVTLKLDDVALWIKGKLSLGNDGVLVKLPAEIRSIYIYETNWTPQHMHLTQNKLQQDGSLKRADLKVKSTSIIRKIGNLCKRISHLIATSSPQMYKVASMKLIIAHDKEGCLYVLGCTSVKMKAPGADRSGLLAETEFALTKELRHLTNKNQRDQPVTSTSNGGLVRGASRQSEDAAYNNQRIADMSGGTIASGFRNHAREQLAEMELALSNVATFHKLNQTADWKSLAKKFSDVRPADRLSAALLGGLAAKEVSEILMERTYLDGRELQYKGVLPLSAETLRQAHISLAEQQRSYAETLSKPNRPSKYISARSMFPPINPSHGSAAFNGQNMDDKVTPHTMKQIQQNQRRQLQGQQAQSLFLQRLSVEEAKGLVRACKQIEGSDSQVPAPLRPAKALLGKSLQRQKQQGRRAKREAAEGSAMPNDVEAADGST